MAVVPTQSCTPAIVISRDRLRAVLRLPAGCPADTVHTGALLRLAQAYDIDIDDQVEAILREVAARFATHRRDIHEVICEGQPPRPGRPGCIEWVPQFDPQRVVKPDAETDQAVNFYEQCPFMLVEAGEHVATLLPPRPGRPGIDVCGQPISPDIPPDHRLVHDDSIQVLDDGRVFTRRAGLLECPDVNHLHVAPVLNIDEHVDFSTGNIRFEGSVFVGGDVRDNFTVECTGNCQVGQIIEAATIRCGGDLRATGGVVGRETGSIHCGGDMWARYLDSARCHVEGHLAVTREIINSEITVLGRLELVGGTKHAGAVIGGRVTCSRSAHVHTLGSAAGVSTVLSLGYVPRLSEALGDVADDLKKVDAQMARYRQHIEGETDPDARAELVTRYEQIEDYRKHLLESRASLRQRFDEQSCVDLHVGLAIHPGVKLELPTRRIEFIRKVEGPIRLLRLATGTIRFENKAGSELTLEDAIRVKENDE